MTKPQLSDEDQRDLRDAASDAFTQTSDRVFPTLRAKILFKKDTRVQRIANGNAATILFFLQIAIALWKFWRDNKVNKPGIAMSGEPIFGRTQ